MTEKRVRKGMLVKRRLPALGLPIGPWLIVRSVERELIGAEVVNISNLLSETGELRHLFKNNVYIPTRAALSVSPSVVKTIAMHSQVIIRHPVLPQVVVILNIDAAIVVPYGIAVEIENGASCVEISVIHNMWKAGQLVTIHGIVFRVKKRKRYGMHSCGTCDARSIPDTCRKLCSFTMDQKLPVKHYLQQVYLKR